MRRILMSSVIAFLILTNPKITNAEPSETIKYLMNEPATLFDLGLYRINQELSERPIPFTIDKAPPATRIYAEYNWDLNRIEINIRYLYGTKKIPNNIKELALFHIDNLKVYLGIDTRTGRPFGKQSRLKEYFIHLNFENKNRPKYLGEKLDQITTFIIEVISPEPKRELIGRSPLLDKNIYWSEVKQKTPQ